MWPEDDIFDFILLCFDIFNSWIYFFNVIYSG